MLSGEHRIEDGIARRPAHGFHSLNQLCQIVTTPGEQPHELVPLGKRELGAVHSDTIDRGVGDHLSAAKRFDRWKVNKSAIVGRKTGEQLAKD